MSQKTYQSSLVALLLVAWAFAQGPAKDATVQAYESLSREYEAQLADFRKAADAARTPAEKRAAFEKKHPRHSVFAPRFLSIAARGPDSPAAVDALTWVVLHPVEPGLRASSARGQALTTLAKTYARDERVSGLCTRLVLTIDPDSEAFLRAMTARAVSPPALARANASLAHNLRHRARLIGQLLEDREGRAEYERAWGKPAVAALLRQKPADLEKESARLFNQLAKRHGDVPHPLHGTMAALARAHLQALESPVNVDRAAPEIAGETLDGKTMKLSDHRGKVVLLDFWAHAFGPSREVFPDEKKLLARLAGKPFVILGVNADADRAAARKASAAAGITWPSWHDGGTGGPIATRWDVDQWPAVVLIDHQGVVRHMWAGWPEAKELDRAVDELVAKAAK